MNFKSISIHALCAMTVACAAPLLSSCGSKSTTATDTTTATDSMSAHENGGKASGPAIDKSGDATLQAMIKSEVPQFKQLVFKDSETGKEMKYNLFAPKNIEAGKKYPLVLFMADASTPGSDYTTPLTQGYGALVWATDEWQAKNPCYVLVPQFSGVAVNDAYEHTDEADIVIRMLKNVTANNSVDTKRLYATGQSMGGMLSMYFNVTYPDIFAASIFVDCHWDTASYTELVKHKFVYFIAGTEGKAAKEIEPIEDAARKVGVQYTFAEWSAKLPELRQSELAATMLEKGAPINLFQFEPKSVLPEDGKGSEHMYSFDYAYKITSVREWLFKQSK